MKKNMGSTDKIIRFILAAIFVALGYFKVVEGTMTMVLYALAGIFVVTSFINFCPLYTIFGVNTCKSQN